jgi:hypothetical protein
MEILVFYGMLAGNPKRKSSSGVPRRRSNQFGAKRRWNNRVGRHRNRVLRPIVQELCLLDLGEASLSFAIAQRFLRSRRTPIAVPQRIQTHRTAAAPGCPPGIESAYLSRNPTANFLSPFECAEWVSAACDGSRPSVLEYPKKGDFACQ